MVGEAKSFKLKYVGGRFAGGRLPVDVVPDLPAFRDLLVAFAKDMWRERNAGRKRLPKGFEKSISFDLTRIEDGSAVPVLEWDWSAAQVPLPGMSGSLADLVDDAYGAVVDLMAGAGVQQFPASLPGGQIRALDKLGSGLKDGERIEFVGSEDASGNVIYLDKYRRKEIITHVKEKYELKYEGVGRLVKNSVAGSITVNTSEYGDIEIPVDPDVVKNTYDGSLDASVQFDLVIELDHNDRLLRIVEVHYANLVDDETGGDVMRCRDRITEMRSLKAGWFNGDGVEIDAHAIDAASQFLEKHSALAKNLGIFPTTEGGIAFEFLSAGWDLSIEFQAGGRVEFYGVQVDGKEEIEPKEFDGLNDAFMAEVSRLIGQ